MALADNDLLVVQKPATRVHYKLKVADLLSGAAAGLWEVVGGFLVPIAKNAKLAFGKTAVDAETAILEMRSGNNDKNKAQLVKQKEADGASLRLKSSIGTSACGLRIDLGTNNTDHFVINTDKTILKGEFAADKIDCGTY